MATYIAESSGYLAAAAAVTWTSGGPNSLAANTYSGLSDEIDNSTTKYMYVDLYLELGSAAFSGASSGIEIYLVPSVTGTSYPKWTGGVSTDETENIPHYVGFMATSASTTTQEMVLLFVKLPPGKYKWAIRNRGGTGVALAASGNTLYWRPHSYISTDA